MPWRGEVAFEDEALAFRGESAENRFHAHAAVQCVFANTGARIRDEDGRVFEGRCLVVQSGISHCLEPASALTLVLIEPQSRWAAGIMRHAEGQSIARMPEDACACLGAPQPLAKALSNFKQQFVGSSVSVDRRVLAALDQLNVISRRDTASAAAAHAGLSASRLRALCRDQLGVPFAKLILWRKVRLAFRAMNEGLSLAQAATDAGFADQAHLTRTMAEVIGLTPSVAARASDSR